MSVSDPWFVLPQGVEALNFPSLNAPDDHLTLPILGLSPHCILRFQLWSSLSPSLASSSSILYVGFIPSLFYHTHSFPSLSSHLAIFPLLSSPPEVVTTSLTAGLWPLFSVLLFHFPGPEVLSSPLPSPRCDRQSYLLFFLLPSLCLLGPLCPTLSFLFSCPLWTQQVKWNVSSCRELAREQLEANAGGRC